MKWVYDFSEGSKEMRNLLGGKGANVAEMTRVLGAEMVPPGFTITTEACVEYMRAGGREPAGLAVKAQGALGGLEGRAGRGFGHDRDPLLNLGLNDRSVAGLAATTDNERFAWDSYRRLVQMFGNVADGVPGDRF